jgi:KUP system potassium uptake protein
MEEPLLMPLLRRLAKECHIPIDVDTATFFIGHSTILPDEGGKLSHIPEAIFAYLKRNAVQEERRYHVPADQVMEIGEQISL